MYSSTITPDVEIAIIGTGFSGLGAAIRLQQDGFADFTIIERNPKVGGTWYNNHYPGCACDVPSHLYSFSFEPNPNWSRMFATQPEIQGYLEHCANKHHLNQRIRFNTWVSGAHWDEVNHLWHIRTHRAEAIEKLAHALQVPVGDLDLTAPDLPGGETFTARTLVSGMGGLSRPSYPNLNGIERFQGAQFHSAQWDHDYDLSGKRVAVVGTGASAIQFVPKIAGEVAQLDLYQRTPPWIMPKPDRTISTSEQTLYRFLPTTQQAQRTRLYWQHEARALGFVVSPRIMGLAQLEARRHLRRQIPDLALRDKLTPDYTMGCKRVLISDDYYPALSRENVDVVTHGIREVRTHSIVDTRGRERPVDAIIYGTGFQPQTPIPRGVIHGRGGRDLYQTWQDGLKAYLGTAVHGYPNLFLLMGPNTGLGHNSMVYMIESQITYLIDALTKMRRKRIAALEVREHLQEQFCDKVQNQSRETVWSSGCRSWYLNEEGRNTTLWPGFTFSFRQRTAQCRLGDYHCIKADEASPVTTDDAEPALAIGT